MVYSWTKEGGQDGGWVNGEWKVALWIWRKCTIIPLSIDLFAELFLDNQKIAICRKDYEILNILSCWNPPPLPKSLITLFFALEIFSLLFDFYYIDVRQYLTKFFLQLF